MTENIQISPGAGAVVGTDEVTINSVAVQVQRVKLIDSQDGGAGAQFPAPGALGDADGNPTTVLLGAALMGWDGAAWVRARQIATVFKTFDFTAATTEQTLWTPASGKKIRVLGLFAQVGSSASKLTFKSGASNPAGTVQVIAGAGANDNCLLLFPGGLLVATADHLLTVARGTSTTLVGTIFGTEE